MSEIKLTHARLKSCCDASSWDAIVSLTDDMSEADSLNPGFWSFRAMALIEIRRTADAVAAAKQGVALDPASSWGNRVVFDAMLADDQIDDAFAGYGEFIDKNEDTEAAKAWYVEQASNLERFDLASAMNEKRDVIKNVPEWPRFALGVQCFCKSDTLEKVFAALCALDGAGQFALVILQDSAYLLVHPEEYASRAEEVVGAISKWLPRLSAQFFSVECFKNNRNLGTAPTCRRLIDYIAGRYEGFLFIEDDCVLAPSALDWATYHLEHTISSGGPWFVTCESSYFDRGNRALDDELRARLAKVAAFKQFKDSYMLIDFVNSTCFGTRSDIWQLCASVRSFTQGPESLTRFVAQRGITTISPTVPRAADIGMLHEFGYSVQRLGATNVREDKHVYLMSIGRFESEWCHELDGDKDLIFRATCDLVPDAIEDVEMIYGNDILTEVQLLGESARSSASQRSAANRTPIDGASIKRALPPGITAVTNCLLRDDASSKGFRAGSDMLKNTLALLTDITPGTYLEDGVECYDAAEIGALGRTLQRLLYAPSSIRRVLQQEHGVTITRADFYSEIPTIKDLEQSCSMPSLLNLESIFPNNAAMVAELDRLMKVSHEFDPPRESDRLGEFAWENSSFSYSDAMAYYSMIRTRKPRTIVEIGSGWQTRVAQMACEKNGMGRIICIEEHPNEFLKALPGIELIKRRTRDIETGFFETTLRDGDILFIDSSHTVKHDGDCLHIYLRVLPAIRANITVQIHDVYLPDTLSLNQMRNQQIFWNEQYLLYAYMHANSRTQAVYGSRYHTRFNPDMLDRFMHGRYKAGGASFWFEQKDL